MILFNEKLTEKQNLFSHHLLKKAFLKDMLLLLLFLLVSSSIQESIELDTNNNHSLERLDIHDAIERFVIQFFRNECESVHVNVSLPIQQRYQGFSLLAFFHKTLKDKILSSVRPFVNHLCCTSVETYVLEQTYQMFQKLQQKRRELDLETEPCFWNCLDCFKRSYPSSHKDFVKQVVCAVDVAIATNDILYLDTNLTYTLVDNSRMPCRYASRRHKCPLIEFVRQ